MISACRVWVLLSVPCLLWALVLLWGPAFWGLVFDDTFYYAQIARNLSTGLGPTFDGFHPTNGFHPLWLGACTALFALGLDGDAAIRAMLLLQVPMLAGGLGMGWVVLTRTRTRRAPDVERAIGVTVLALLLVAAGSKDLVKLWINGLESGLVLLLQTALLAVAARGNLLDPHARRSRLLVGALLAGAFLARTDAALLLPAIALWALPRFRRAPGPTARALVELLLTPSIVVLAFMAFNQAWMGYPVQVSGMLKSAPLDGWRGTGAVLVMLAPWIVARRLPHAKNLHLGRLVARTGFQGIFSALLVTWYVCLGRFPRLWYFGPVAAWLLLVAGAGLADLLARAASENPDVSAGKAVRPLQLLFGGLGLLVVGHGVLGLTRLDSASPLLANREAALHIARTLPPDAVLASWDAGVLGFYARRPVVNLDGVVQSGKFLRSLSQGTTPDLLAPVPIGWIANHADQDDGPDHLQRLARRSLGPRADPLTLVGRWPFSVRASINGAMPVAHRMEVLLLALPGTTIPEAAWALPERATTDRG
ncbi:MAG: hypothetical protein JXB39_08815 [Deltaproteobacteria bacterium]|nr:hypothetical protein [Deltaproteobacteria bacterium]